MSASGRRFSAAGQPSLRVNYNSRLGGELPQQCQKIVVLQSDAASSGAESRACNVDENSAAAAGDARPSIVVDFDDEIVEAVVAAQAVAWFSGRPLVGVVVTPIVRVLAPSVVSGDPANRQACLRPRQTVGAPPQPDRAKAAGRRAAVAFALVGLDAGAAERDRYGNRTGGQPALASPAWPGIDVDDGKRSPSHGRDRPVSQSAPALVS